MYKYNYRRVKIPSELFTRVGGSRPSVGRAYARAFKSKQILLCTVPIRYVRVHLFVLTYGRLARSPPVTVIFRN